MSAALASAFLVGIAGGFGGYTSWHAAGVLSEYASTTEAAVQDVAAAPTAVMGPFPSPDAVALADLPAVPAPLAVIHHPSRVEAPAANIDAVVVPLGLDTDGALEAPSDFDTAGWWQGGSSPGAPGPAVIAGHVDSHNGPAAFFSLRELELGDAITVHGQEGETVTFHVHQIEQYSKNQFPTQRVYGPTAEQALRLITCAGSFDHASGHYSDNLIVYAR